eukprot:scaffold19276_cov60-Attheya_sp.AAC.3
MRTGIRSTRLMYQHMACIAVGSTGTSMHIGGKGCALDISSYETVMGTTYRLLFCTLQRLIRSHADWFQNGGLHHGVLRTSLAGLTETIEKGAQQSQDDAVSLGKYGYVFVHSTYSNQHMDYDGVVLMEKARATHGGCNTVLGSKFEIEKGIERVAKQLRSQICFFFTDGLKGKAVYDDALVTVKAQVLSFLSFEDNLYEELHTAGVKKTEAWVVVWLCVEKIFDEIETEHTVGRKTPDDAILSGHWAVGLLAKDRFINLPALTSIMVQMMVLENQGTEDWEGGGAMAQDMEGKTTHIKMAVGMLKQDIGQLKVDGNKCRDRLKKLEEEKK